MKRLRDCSLRFKLTLIVMTTTCVTLVAALVGLACFDQVSFREQVSRQMLIRSSTLGNSSTAALSFNDPELGREILSALRAEPTLGAAMLYDQEGKLFARYTRTNWKLPPPTTPLHEGVVFGSDHLQVVTPVLLANRTIGYAVLQSDLSRVEERDDRFARVGLGVIVAAAAFGYLLSGQLQRFITRPILELARTSRAITASRNYSLRARRHGEDELGQLVDGFNEMVSEVESREAALRAAQEELESRIAERTRELFLSNARLKE
jgi:methyl-accepting chemotaxis protein